MIEALHPQRFYSEKENEDVYSDEGVAKLLEGEEITESESGFMEGFNRE
ncbi:MAG: hypothetical protein MUP58_03575 [Candidatus Nanohaloarchaeota archaeon QJJ-9]|nr:hypothetical protein [Candidatus Nanohaloarchaeota archaeon QJJ-9]